MNRDPSPHLPETRAISLDEFLDSWSQARHAENSTQAVRSPVRVELRDQEGKRTRLEGALAVRTPGDVRLKLWKHGRDVMDLTRRNGQAFAWVDESAVKRARSAEPLDVTDRALPAFGSMGNRLERWLLALAWLVASDSPRDFTVAQLDVAEAFFLGGLPTTLATETIEATTDHERLTFDVQTGSLLARQPIAEDDWSAAFTYTHDRDDGLRRRSGMTLRAGGHAVSITLTDPTWNETLSDVLFVPSDRAQLLGQATPLDALP